METITPTIKYGPLHINQEYQILFKGKDFYCVKFQGRCIYVPTYVFAQDIFYQSTQLIKTNKKEENIEKDEYEDDQLDLGN